MYDPWKIGGLNPSFFVFWGGLAPPSPYVEPPLLATPLFARFEQFCSFHEFLRNVKYQRFYEPLKCSILQHLLVKMTKRFKLDFTRIVNPLSLFLIQAYLCQLR